jgi:NAD(P)-dependent dehydrogenase (short-subunit alcohol dehydrogenase family)
MSDVVHDAPDADPHAAPPPAPDAIRLDGAVALVTGATRGLGAAVARAFAARGASLVLTARDGVLLRTVVRSLHAAGAPEVLPVAGDLADPDVVRRAADAARARFGRLTCLVNNAARLGPRVAIADYPEAEWDATLAVNLTAPFRLIRACLPLLRAAATPGGLGPTIINVSSGVGRRGKARWGAYAVSKFGIEGLTQVLAADLADGPPDAPPPVVALAINAGPTRTAMRAAAYPQEDPATVTPPEEVARVFVWAAGSPDARVYHGQTVDAQAILAAWRPRAAPPDRPGGP